MLGLSVCLLDNCSQFAGALHRYTHGLEKFAVGTLTLVGSPSGVETCTFVLLCGVIVVQLLLVVAPQVTGVKIEICVLCMQKTSFVVVRWLHSSLVPNPVQQQ